MYSVRPSLHSNRVNNIFDEPADRGKWQRKVLTAKGLLVNKRLPQHNFTATDLTRIRTIPWTKTFESPGPKPQVIPSPIALALLYSSCVVKLA